MISVNEGNGRSTEKADRPPLESDRYLEIMEASRMPILSFFKEALKEDKRLLLPRALDESLKTALRIPRSLFMPDGPKRENYVFKTLDRWAKKICSLFQIRLEVVGPSRLSRDETYLFVANHQSPADIVALYAALPVQAGFVATSLLAQVPVFSYWMHQSGAVFVEQGDRRGEMLAFRTMVDRLKRGRSLILFPEGYMHQGSGLAEFNRGGIHSALIARVPIVPVYIGGTADVMRSGSLRIEPRKNVVVEFGDPIEVSHMRREERESVDLRLRRQIAAMKERRTEERSA